MKNTEGAKNSDIILNHDDYGMTQDEATAFVMSRMAEYTRNNSGAAFEKAPKNGWTDADRIAK